MSIEICHSCNEPVDTDYKDDGLYIDNYYYCWYCCQDFQDQVLERDLITADQEYNARKEESYGCGSARVSRN